jgi:S-adenosylmethionine hydrolase
VKRIITLTTDFGLDDHYVGAMKGVILGINPDALITDITHEIPKYDIFKAAFTARNIYPYFPKETIHIVVVDPGVGSERKPIAVQTEKGVFIGPDNGVFSFILEENKDINIIEITNPEYMLEETSNTFHARDIFAPAAAHISLGVDINELGPGIESPVLLDFPEPTISEDEIIGEVVYTDSFGNLITNIPGDFIEGYSKIHIDKFIIDSVASSYQDAGKGALLAIIGSSGFLEISVNRGSASELIRDRKLSVLK